VPGHLCKEEVTGQFYRGWLDLPSVRSDFLDSGGYFPIVVVRLVAVDPDPYGPSAGGLSPPCSPPVGVEPVADFAARVRSVADAKRAARRLAFGLFGACGAPLGVCRSWSIAAEELYSGCGTHT
jgi:hypothetical protein